MQKRKKERKSRRQRKHAWQVGQIANSKAADSGGKIIFENAVLCSQLLSGYVELEELKNVRPQDIEDVTERYIPMFTEQRDADVVKKVHLPEGEDIFIALIEHKSAVDYNVIMQILRYMVYIWEDYENQQDKLSAGISKTKGFKYPPVLPIVYYEGREEWTADRELSERIVLNEVFKDYIPNFRYYLIQLKEHDKEELIGKKDELSFVMLINKLKDAEGFKSLELPEEYLSDLFIDSSDDVLKAIAKVIAVVLRKQNIPEDDVQDMVDRIRRRQPMGLWDDWKGFDYQEAVRTGETKGETNKLIKLICKKIQKGKLPDQIAEELDEDDVEYIREIYNIALKHAPAYDIQEIYEELSKKDALVKS